MGRTHLVAGFLLIGSQWACSGGPDPATARPTPAVDGGGTHAGDGGTPSSPDGGTTPSGTVVTVGGSTPLDPGDDGSTGVKTDDKGGIVLDPGSSKSDSSPIIWIANSDEGTVSKVETRSLKELARYRTGPGSYPDPSRTTVSLLGDVVVANRTGSSATKIAGDLARCVDRNGDGKIETSSGATDVLPWGQDECVLWNTPFPGGTLARAAAFDAQVDVDGSRVSKSVWIGLYNAKQVKQLDAETGKELATLDVAPVRPYGAAVDRDGNLWVRGDGIVTIDPAHKVTHIVEPPCGYGLAVDQKGRVFIGGAKCVARYAPDTGKWVTAPAGVSMNRGLAVDGKGSVWVADTTFGVHQLNAETLAVVKDIPLGLTNMVGMAIDYDGMVWAVSQGSSIAVRIDPTTYQTQQFKTGKGPYTYSDMTGFQLRNAVAKDGAWRHLFQGCGDDARFESLSYDVSLVPGTSIVVRGRWASDKAALAATPWTTLATSPPEATTIDLAKKLGGKAPHGAFFEVEVQLKSSSGDMSPVLHSVSLGMSCEPIIG